MLLFSVTGLSRFSGDIYISCRISPSIHLEHELPRMKQAKLNKLNYSLFPALNKFLLMIMPQELLFSWWRQRFLMPRENIFVAHEIFKRHLEFVKKDIVFCEKDSYLLTKRQCLLMKRQLFFNILMRNKTLNDQE